MLVHLAALAATFLAASDSPITLTLDAVLARVASAPQTAAAEARAQASAERARSAGSVPMPMLRAQQWMAPRDQPWDISGTDMVMLGVEQPLIAPPILAKRSAAARAGARAEEQMSRRTGQEVRAQATRAFASWWRASREVAAHRSHATLASQTLSQAESRYAAGQARQVDVLRASLEWSRLHADVAMAEQARDSARAVLDALMGLAPGADPGEPVLAESRETLPEIGVLLARLPSSRPELAAARARAESAEASRRAARLDAFVPDVGVGVDWMRENSGRQGWGTMVTVGVPFLWGGRRAEARAAASEKRAADQDAIAALRAAGAELIDAHARATAAQTTADLYREEVLPSANRTAEAARAAWTSGNATLLDVLDAERSRLDVELASDRSREALLSARADLELALGAPLSTGDVK